MKVVLNDIVSQLSSEQQQPIKNKKQNASILAGAGSGKTKTLVHMLLVELIKGIPPEGIIAFTFTEKAAEELLIRIHKLTEQHIPEIDLTGIYIGTIHAWCFKYLVEQSEFYNFTPIDELHAEALISRLYDYLDLNNIYSLLYPKAVPKFMADMEVFYNESLEISQVPLNIRSCIKKYLDILYQNRLITFGGMIRYAIEHLQKNGPVQGLQRLYVDEYQDVNPAQVNLIKAMIPNEGKIVVVGDDLQCIYNWRGSDLNRILNFTEEFADSSVFRLSTNYRSNTSLVAFANHIAENISLRDKEKVMKPADDSQADNSVHWISFCSEEEQADGVANIVLSFVNNGVPYKKIAVLLRSVIGSGQSFVDAFEKKGIPVFCPTLSRGGEFINRFLIPVFDWLRKEHAEPRNEIEEQEAEQIADALWHSAENWVLVPQHVFWQELNDWHDAIEKKKSDTYDVRGYLYKFLDRCGISISPGDDNLMVGVGIASQILRSVEEIHRRRINGQPRRTPKGVITEIYHALIRKQREFGESMPVEHTYDGVLITTVHQAKGLEWPIVIIPMLINKKFPVNSSGHGTSFPDEIASRYSTTIEDERRLFYVAATRAKERLFLTDPVLHGSRSRSVFLNELEGKAIKMKTFLSEVPESVWKINLKHLKDTDTPPIRIGLLDLLIYLECPFQFGLRRLAGIQPSVGEELGFGKGLHEIIQRHFESASTWSQKELEIYIKEHVRLPYMSEKGEKQSQQTIKKRVEEMEKLGLFEATVESEILIESVFEFGIVHGVIDGVIINSDGTVTVRDWKSNIHLEFIQRYERQLQFYVYALCSQGRKVKNADIVDVAKTSEEKRLVRRNINIDKQTITTLIEKINSSLNKIAEGQFPVTPGVNSCSLCDIYHLCSERWKSEMNCKTYP